MHHIICGYSLLRIVAKVLVFLCSFSSLGIVQRGLHEATSPRDFAKFFYLVWYRGQQCKIMFWRILCNLNSYSGLLLLTCNLTVVKMHGLSMTFWLTTHAWIWSPAQSPQSAASFTDWWFLAIHAVLSALRKGTSSLIQFTIWEIWRHHNVQVFNSVPPDVHCLLTSYCVGRSRGVRPQGDYSGCPWRVVVFFGVLMAVTSVSLSLRLVTHTPS